MAAVRTWRGDRPPLARRVDADDGAARPAGVPARSTVFRDGFYPPEERFGDDGGGSRPGWGLGGRAATDGARVEFDPADAADASVA